jgi:aarF domain-containing kinase
MLSFHHRSIRASKVAASSLSKLVFGGCNDRLRSFAAKSSNDTAISNRALLWYSVIGGFVITVAGAVRKLHDEVGSTEGLKRAISFYSLAIPKYVEYQWHLWRKSSDEVWDDLDTRTSKVGLDKIRELKGFYVKCGQMCAANIGDAFPEVWQDTMSVLQDQVPAQDYATIRQVIDSEMDFDSVFASFEKEPIGAASIGQVHRATLKDGTK